MELEEENKDCQNGQPNGPSIKTKASKSYVH